MQKLFVDKRVPIIDKATIYHNPKIKLSGLHVYWV